MVIKEATQQPADDHWRTLKSNIQILGILKIHLFFSCENVSPVLNNAVSAEETQYCNWQYLNMMQSLEQKIESKFAEFSARLHTVEHDIVSLKSKESDSALCSSSSESGNGGKRKKRSPSELQVH